MSAITTLNPKAESARQAQALAINISAARGLAEMLKTNLGPKGTMKMSVISIVSHHLYEGVRLGWFRVLVILKLQRMEIHFFMKWFVGIDSIDE